MYCGTLLVHSRALDKMMVLSRRNSAIFISISVLFGCLLFYVNYDYLYYPFQETDTNQHLNEFFFKIAIETTTPPTQQTENIQINTNPPINPPSNSPTNQADPLVCSI